MRRAASPTDEPRARVARLIILLAAATLSAIAGCEVRTLWLSLPAVHLRQFLDQDGPQRRKYEQAFRDAGARMPAEARQGLIAANLSALFTAALREPDVYARNRDTVANMVGQLHGTQLGRLQLAALLMLELERAGTPVAQWWPTLEPVLGGLERARFPHFLCELIDNRARVYESLGFGPGSARAQAEQLVGHPHGPFLQFLVDRLQRVAEAGSAAGDRSAQLCLRLTQRLLRDWVLDPGPVGLRLLAADLLADGLDDVDEAAAATGTAELARNLRAWRAAYHAGAAARPEPVPLLSLRRAPETRPAVYYKLVGHVSLTVWTLAATLAGAAVALACFLLSPRAALRVPRTGRLALVGTGTAALIVAAWFAWSVVAAGTMVADLTRLGTANGGWPKQPIAAVALTLILLGAWALPAASPGKARRVRAARVALVAGWTWLLLGIFLHLAVVFALAELGFYEECVGQTLREGAYEAFTGREAPHLLDRVRAWQP